ncbi:GerAB/ArcD/ProY family transporter [Metabacillus sp. RGM 3146]|uniref:GerAB/ArcD/ProY family transporter n=1 Tax=Metabacillus sp. RGM 3146 TaxID=3401092 RepID=UPI003B9A7AE0
MEKAKISKYQFFVLMMLFELGSSLLVPLAIQAHQDAWFPILLGTGGGILLFLVFYKLYRYYPDLLLTSYIPKIIGSIPGNILSYIYILYFAYLAARVLRDFGEMLLTFAYPETPIFIANALLMLSIIYTVRKGIEVVARTGELLLALMYFLAIIGFILIVFSGLIDVNNLKPVMENGFSKVFEVFLKETLYIPFGEAIAFTMILPYINEPKHAKWAGIIGIGLSGFNLAIVMAVNVAVLGANLTERSMFPLLSTIQMIQVAEFLERLDIFFMIALIIGGFFKIGIYLYAAVIGTSSLFKIKTPSSMAFPVGLAALILSISIASSFPEHLEEGLKIVPIYLHLPLQVFIPVLLLIIAFFKNRKKTKAS